MFKVILGNILKSGANPDMGEIQSVESAESKTDYTMLVVFASTVILFLGILYFISKTK